jgi:hypothetical protein
VVACPGFRVAASNVAQEPEGFSDLHLCGPVSPSALTRPLAIAIKNEYKKEKSGKNIAESNALAEVLNQPRLPLQHQGETRLGQA